MHVDSEDISQCKAVANFFVVRVATTTPYVRVGTSTSVSGDTTVTSSEEPAGPIVGVVATGSCGEEQSCLGTREQSLAEALLTYVAPLRPALEAREPS